MEKKKLVKRDYFNALAKMIADTGFSTENITNEEFAKFVANELNLLAKKNVSKDGEKKLTDKDIEKLTIAKEAYGLMEDNMLYTCTQLMKLTPSMNGFTNQRAYGIVKVMMADGMVENIKDKGKSYFRKIAQ